MANYKFVTREFGISETGIHLLRSNFNYETFDFNTIPVIEITKGKLINNWTLILAIGIGLIAFSIYYVFGLVDVFNDDSIGRIYIEEIIVPLLPLLMGCYCIHSAMRNGTVIKIQRNEKNHSYPLEDLVKQNEYENFISYLKSNKELNAKLKNRY